MLEKYADDSGFKNKQFFVDDGFSGTNFDRPDWKRLMGYVDKDMVGTIIVKDMSRLGRDYLKVGHYTDEVFPEADIRFIAVNNGVDSGNNQDSDFTPFLNIINEWYAKDTSKKIRAVARSKGESGKPLCSIPSYGYMKDPEDHNKWVVDEEAATVVKQIFKLCMQGYGVVEIANKLTAMRIPNPASHAIENGKRIPARPQSDDPCQWCISTIARILSKQEYLGHTVNFKTRRKSYKNKKMIKNDPSEWLIFKNTHEAIIDEETFNTVQRIRDGRRRQIPIEGTPLFSGMIFCADCGNKMYQARSREWSRNRDYYVCATYRKHTGKCTSHSIRNVVLEKLVLKDLQRVTAFAHDYEDEFIKMVIENSTKNMNRRIKSSITEHENANTRIEELDTIIQQLYEDNISGKITDERFSKMIKTYESEQQSLLARTKDLNDFMETAEEKARSSKKFIALVRQYTMLDHLDTEILHTFIKKIIVHKAVEKNGKRSQKIQIIYNYIGECETLKKKIN